MTRRTPSVLAVSCALAVLLLGAAAGAAVVFEQPHNGGGTLHKSAWYPPDGLDGDAYCWENFTLPATTAVTTVQWRGGYEYHPAGSGQSPVADFEVSIWRSIAGGSQPDLGAGGRLVRYYVGGNAGETPAGSFGGVALNDYSFALPSPFPATGGVKYWVRIVASQGAAAPSYAPDWGLATGTGGNGFHFRYITGGNYQAPLQDLALRLLASDGPTATIDVAVAPTGAGTATGAGSYPLGTLVSLQATANAGWGFANWTENGVQVSPNAHYTFTAAGDRLLVANFTAAWTINTAAWPDYAGSVSGGGVYNDGQTVTLTATPAHGFVFAGWSDGSLTPTISFPAASDLWLTAFFDAAPGFATFDFDGATPGSGLPQWFTAGGIGATFSGGYSVQPVGTLGIAPLGMSGYYLYPSSVFPSDLVIDFDLPVVDFSLLFAPDELACDTSATLRATASYGGTFVATATATAPVPGTYPSGTLSLVSAAPFTHVVVHWESPGQGCGDYGPIFFADRVIVQSAPTSPVPGGGLPAVARLLDPTPNPFNPATRVRFALPAPARVRIDVVDPAGRRLRTLVDETRPAGEQAVTWDGTDDAGRALGSGVYLLRLQAGSAYDARRLVLLK